MSGELREQIYKTLNLKNTDELLEIWETNDREEWSDTAFEVIEEILQGRGVEIPEQQVDNSEGFTKQELKIIDDDNPPEFYDSFEVLQLIKWLKWASIASIVIALAFGLFAWIVTRSIFLQIYGAESWSMFNVFSSTCFPLIIMTIGFYVVFLYLPLKALARILEILMEMEFNSRKAKL